MQAFSEVLYKYTHRKLYDMIVKPLFKLLISQFVCSEDFENMLENDETLKKCPDIYRKTAHTLLSLANIEENTF